MKKLFKVSGYILATVLMLIMSQFTVFASGENSNNPSSLSGLQVVGGLFVLLLVILIPLMKRQERAEIK
jgi:hypothetical protein